MDGQWSPRAAVSFFRKTGGAALMVRSDEQTAMGFGFRRYSFTLKGYLSCPSSTMLLLQRLPLFLLLSQWSAVTVHSLAHRPPPHSGTWPVVVRRILGAWRGVKLSGRLLGLYGDRFPVEWEEGKDENTSATTVQIALIGMGRTGTTSLAIALEILGYSVFHDEEYRKSSDLYEEWHNDIIDEDDYHEELGKRGYNVSGKSTTLDWVREKPDIKVILTVRDSPQAYVDSWLAFAQIYNVIRRRPFVWSKATRDLYPDIKEEVLMDPTDEKPELAFDRDHLMAVYQNYEKRVVDAIPSSRLLVFNVKQGWGPLCAFLNVTTPQEPFPNANDKVMKEAEFFVLRLVTWIWPLPFLLPLLALLWWYLHLKTKSTSKVKVS